MSGLFQLSNSSYLSFINSDQTLNYSYFVHMVREGDNQKIVEHYEASISKIAIDLCFPLS
jgi:hypothetical protein